MKRLCSTQAYKILITLSKLLISFTTGDMSTQAQEIHEFKTAPLTINTTGLIADNECNKPSKTLQGCHQGVFNILPFSPHWIWKQQKDQYPCDLQSPPCIVSYRVSKHSPHY